MSTNPLERGMLYIIAWQLQLRPIYRPPSFICGVDRCRRQNHWNGENLCVAVGLSKTGVTNISCFVTVFKYLKCNHFRSNMHIVLYSLLVGLMKTALKLRLSRYSQKRLGVILPPPLWLRTCA